MAKNPDEELHMLVWPYDGIKNCLISPQNCPKSSHTLIYKQVTLLQIAQKVAKIFGLLLGDNLVPRTCKNSPNLVTLIARSNPVANVSQSKASKSKRLNEQNFRNPNELLFISRNLWLRPYSELNLLYSFHSTKVSKNMTEKFDKRKLIKRHFSIASSVTHIEQFLFVC